MRRTTTVSPKWRCLVGGKGPHGRWSRRVELSQGERCGRLSQRKKQALCILCWPGQESQGSTSFCFIRIKGNILRSPHHARWPSHHKNSVKHGPWSPGPFSRLVEAKITQEREERTGRVKCCRRGWGTQGHWRKTWSREKTSPGPGSLFWLVISSLSLHSCLDVTQAAAATQAGLTPG